MEKRDRKLPSAAKYGTLEEVRVRLAAGDDVNSPSDTGLTALLSAVTNSDSEQRLTIVDALLEAGADASLTSEPENFNVLHALLDSRIQADEKAELLSRLVDAGADINLRDARGVRPLALLVRSRIPEDQLATAYDAVFTIDGLVLTEPANQWDQSVLDSARKLRRTELVGRIEDYLTALGIPVPPPPTDA